MFWAVLATARSSRAPPPLPGGVLRAVRRRRHQDTANPPATIARPERVESCPVLSLGTSRLCAACLSVRCGLRCCAASARAAWLGLRLGLGSTWPGLAAGAALGAALGGAVPVVSSASFGFYPPPPPPVISQYPPPAGNVPEAPRGGIVRSSSSSSSSPPTVHPPPGHHQAGPGQPRPFTEWSPAASERAFGSFVRPHRSAPQSIVHAITTEYYCICHCHCHCHSHSDRKSVV